ncbi:MAG: hypothetical protein FWE93_06920 [Alphaproteobacteria bacterium]|nr:hypothetical protein [Alphaproteobacteria bacterium]
MLVELTPTTYLTLCGLVRDALLVESDAAPLLKLAEKELAGLVSSDLLPSELLEQPEHIENLRRAGIARK